MLDILLNIMGLLLSFLLEANNYWLLILTSDLWLSNEKILLQNAKEKAFIYDWLMLILIRRVKLIVFNLHCNLGVWTMTVERERDPNSSVIISVQVLWAVKTTYMSEAYFIKFVFPLHKAFISHRWSSLVCSHMEARQLQLEFTHLHYIIPVYFFVGICQLSSSFFLIFVLYSMHAWQ